VRSCPLLPILMTVLGAVSVSPAQDELPSVPGFDVEVYAKVTSPVKLAFDPDGVLYVGHCTSPTASVRIYRIGRDRSVTDFGPPIYDPDSVLFDAKGVVSGIDGDAVLVGSAGKLVAIPLSDPTGVVQLCTGRAYTNLTDFALFSDGSLLIADENGSSGFISKGCAAQNLASEGHRAGTIAADADDRIYFRSLPVGSANGAIRRYLPSGILDRTFSGPQQGDFFFLGRGPWGEFLYANEMVSGKLLKIDLADGSTSVAGTGFKGRMMDAEFGPDGKLYVSDYTNGRILRVSPASRQLPGDCNQDGQLDISDALCVFRTLFTGEVRFFPCGDGTASDPANRALLHWTADDAGVDISDAIALLSFIFLGGPPHPRAVRDGDRWACITIPGCPVDPRPGCGGPAPSKIIIYVTGSGNASDPSGGWYLGPASVDPLRLHLETLGFDVEVLDHASAPSIDSQVLAGADQVWILEGDQDQADELDPGSVDALVAFHDRGGNIWVSMENAPWQEDTADLLARFSVSGSGQAAGPNAPSLCPSPAHPLFTGVDHVTFDDIAGSVTIPSAPPFEVLFEYRPRIGQQVSGIVLLDETPQGKGRLLIDSGWMIGYAYCKGGNCPRNEPAASDNLRFAANVARYFAVRK